MAFVRIVLAATLFSVGSTLNVDFVVDFLKMKHSKSVVFFGCDYENSYKLFSSITTQNITTRFVNINDQLGVDPTEILPQTNYARTACIIDYSCENALTLLQKFSDQRFFNTTYSWLFLANKEPILDVDAVLWKLKSVQINSDITVVDPILEAFNESVYNLVDIHSQGRHLCKDIYRNTYGRWNSSGGISLIPNYNRYYLRGDFKNLQLRGVVVIDRDNVTSNDVDRLIAGRGHERGVTAFVKYHYALLIMLRDYHNFSIKFRIAKAWAGHLKSGYRLGLLGILARNEADVAATGIFQRINRHAEFDIVHQSWEFTAGFIYRMTPQLSGSAGEGNFFSPFKTELWLSAVISLAIVLLSLKLTTWIISKLYKREPNVSLAAYLVMIVGSVTQQGIPGYVSPWVPIRLILVTLLVLNLVLFNYYTSAVVSGLLSSLGDGPETIREIIDSPLELAFLDIGYHKILFRESKAPLIRELYDKKVLPAIEKRVALPVYTDIETVVPFLQKGGYAFHCEMTEAFQAIAEQFDANEICELRTTNGMFNDLKLISFVVPKRSMYTEMFRITMMRVKEIGVIKRTLKIHRIEKPECQAGNRVFPVELAGVVTAIFILAGGMILSLVILILEKIMWNMRQINIEE